jgi:hypothetical protein
MHDEQSRTPKQDRASRRLERLGLCVAVCGVALLAAGGFYDMHSFRSSPTVPDKTHREIQESHGIVRYKTRGEISTFHALNIGGLTALGVGVAMLFVYRHRQECSA